MHDLEDTSALVTNSPQETEDVSLSTITPPEIDTTTTEFIDTGPEVDASLFTEDVGVEEEDANESSDIFTSLEVQQDSPIYRDASVEVVKLDGNATLDEEMYKPVSGESKLVDSKELTDANLLVVPVEEPENLKSVHFQDSAANQTNDSVFAKSRPSDEPNIRVFQVPPPQSSSGQPQNSNRVLVNVTITTEPDSRHPIQNIYVLSVSLPADDIAHNYEPQNIKMKAKEEGVVTPKAEENDKISHWNGGGGCECSCPCLESSNEFSELNNSDYYDYNELFGLNSTTTVKPNSSTTVSSTLSEETASTSCPEVTTKLPRHQLFSFLKVGNRRTHRSGLAI